MQIKIKKLSDTAKIPTKADDGAAGWDLYADIPEGTVHISANKTGYIDTGIALEIPAGYWGGIYARSGLACKHGLRPANCVGVIDSSYRDSIKIALHNDSPQPIPLTAFDALFFNVKKDEWTHAINHGDRIAQLIIHKCEDVEFAEADELSNTKRGTGGFGSSVN